MNNLSFKGEACPHVAVSSTLHEHHWVVVSFVLRGLPLHVAIESTSAGGDQHSGQRCSINNKAAKASFLSSCWEREGLCITHRRGMDDRGKMTTCLPNSSHLFPPCSGNNGCIGSVSKPTISRRKSAPTVWSPPHTWSNNHCCCKCSAWCGDISTRLLRLLSNR